MAGRTSLTVFRGMTGMSENVFINVKNRSHTITAEVEIPKGGLRVDCCHRRGASAAGASI
jgi:arylsulfatase